MNFFIDLVLMASFFPFFLLTFVGLWRLRSRGFHTVFLGFFFQMVFLRIGFAIAPQAMQYHYTIGMSPVELGISMGCGMPVLFMTLYYLNLKLVTVDAAVRAYPMAPLL